MLNLKWEQAAFETEKKEKLQIWNKNIPQTKVTLDSLDENIPQTFKIFHEHCLINGFISKCISLLPLKQFIDYKMLLNYRTDAKACI